MCIYIHNFASPRLPKFGSDLRFCTLLYTFNGYVTEITWTEVSDKDLLDTYSISEEAKLSEPPNSNYNP